MDAGELPEKVKNFTLEGRRSTGRPRERRESLQEKLPNTDIEEGEHFFTQFYHIFKEVIIKLRNFFHYYSIYLNKEQRNF